MTIALAAILTICTLAAVWTGTRLAGRAARRPQLCVLCREAPTVTGLDTCQRCWLDEHQSER
ncbi:hypothetical protein [Roseisolibacter sp. H3M3-2]|uniref:hypothetical protein n=1 Tax=Roseisolibacter sp. H3M3-2 TaxID=3031323 RepID=UPI0023DB18F4|nr:hypothetical protein [Roseisolibacter sp. H3M3-2]MDF1506211.1 hypothetical protein [Roseisolibacter sp. H3M3-2]